MCESQFLTDVFIVQESSLCLQITYKKLLSYCDIKNIGPECQEDTQVPQKSDCNKEHELSPDSE